MPSTLGSRTMDPIDSGAPSGPHDTEEAPMGMFQQMKEMTSMVQAAPSMVQAAQAASQEAQRLGSAMQARQLAARAVTVTAAAANPAHLEPIAGVTLERYAEVSRGLAAYGYDSSMAVTIAAGFGTSADEWQAAMDGWNARIAVSPTIARAFNLAYTGR